MFHCYFIVNGNKRKSVTKRRSINLIHIRPCHIPSQLSAHGNITELRKMQWLLFNLFFPSNFEYHLCSGHMFESSICGHCYRNDFFLTPFLNVVAYPLKLLGTFICMPEFLIF